MRHPEHRVCKVKVTCNDDDKDIEVIESYGGQKGGEEGQLNEPCHMALSRNGFVFVADFNNGRVVTLDPSLRFVRAFTGGAARGREMDRFQRLCLDNESQTLYIGDYKGDVTILRLTWNH